VGSVRDRPSRSTDQTRSMSNLLELTALIMESSPGRLSLPFAPLIPASSKIRTTLIAPLKLVSVDRECATRRKAEATFSGMAAFWVERRETFRYICGMRRVICFILYLGMIFVGSAIFGLFLISGGRGIIFISGGFLAAFGAYLMWIDFLAPNTEHL